MTTILKINDGHSQAQRQLPGLRKHYFRLNELRFEQLLGLAHQYAGLMNFVDIDLSVKGDWKAFYEVDEIMLFASLLNLRVADFESQFNQRIQNKTIEEMLNEDLEQTFSFEPSMHFSSPLLLARLLDHCLVRTQYSYSETSVNLHHLIQSILRGLESEILHLLGMVPDYFERVSKEFSAIFKQCVNWPKEKIKPNPDAQNTERSLKYSFITLCQAFKMVQRQAQRLLPISLKSQNHDPAISLLIGFIHLFDRVLVRLNDFSEHRLDFYYHQVLRMEMQAQRPDRAYLVMKPHAVAKHIAVPKGTEFSAGVDAEFKEIIYTSQVDAHFNDAQVVQLHTLFWPERVLHHEATNSDKNNKSSDMHQVAQSKVRETAACIHTSIPVRPVDNEMHEERMSYPVLGAPHLNEERTQGLAARFGFVLASKVLFLREGLRKIRLEFQYQNDAKHSLEYCVKKLAEELEPNYRQKNQHEKNILHNDVFVKLTRNMFQISLSTEQGWYAISDYTPDCQLLNEEMGADCLALEFELPESAPAIIAGNPLVHGADYTQGMPLIRLEMTQNDYRYPYDILKNWILKHIKISVQVFSCRNLLLQNEHGLLPSSGPFLAFGPMPSLGSYLIIGSQELVEKQLTDVELDITWGNLPRGLGGFQEHYLAYRTPLQTSSAKVNTAILVDGKWIVSGKYQALFVNENSYNDIPAEKNTWSFKDMLIFHKPQTLKSQQKQASFSYSHSSMAGFVKVILGSPEDPFGHEEYPQLLSKVLTYNSRIKKESLHKPLPKLPYKPQIESVKLNYSASSTLNLQNLEHANDDHDQMMHLYPLGIKHIQKTDFKKLTQVPYYHSPAQLFIGIQAQQLRGILSLYFHLKDDSLPLKEGQHTSLVWSYLLNNRWHRLEARHIINDSSFGLSTSGIVRLNLPDDLHTENTIMPVGLYWLKVTTSESLHHFASVYQVHAQALEVVWDASQGQKNSAILTPYQIQKPRLAIAGLEKTIQVEASFQGKEQENKEQFRIRASERLRHKNRALTAIDYELLILEKFPEIFKVKCFTNLKSSLDEPFIQAGHILIIVLPHFSQHDKVHLKPMLSGYTIQKVRDFIQNFAPSTARISVENPIYEFIQVRCKLLLKPGFQAGLCLQQLNQLLCDFISPWHSLGYRHHFGWQIREHDLISFLLEQACVENVYGLSLLQIAPQNSRTESNYQLLDSARMAGREISDDATKVKQRSLNAASERAVSRSENSTDLYSNFPWSVAIPMRQHYLEILPARSNVNVEPTPVGVNDLSISSTFIIS
jgi:hypothetical protein